MYQQAWPTKFSFSCAEQHPNSQNQVCLQDIWFENQGIQILGSSYLLTFMHCYHLLSICHHQKTRQNDSNSSNSPSRACLIGITPPPPQQWNLIIKSLFEFSNQQMFKSRENVESSLTEMNYILDAIQFGNFRQNEFLITTVLIDLNSDAISWRRPLRGGRSSQPRSSFRGGTSGLPGGRQTRGGRCWSWWCSPEK